MKSDQLKGIWAAVVSPLNTRVRLDEKIFVDNLYRFMAVGMHGVYTTDSTGEFYAFEWEDYQRMARLFVRTVQGSSIGTGLGVAWLNTEGVIRRLKLAQDLGIQTAHVCFPFWMPMTRDSWLRFFDDISEAAPSIGLVHYNTPRGRVLLKGIDYSDLTKRVPNLIGTKQVSTSLEDLTDIMFQTPKLAHFVLENALLPGVMLGARGAYSYLANINPRFCLDWWATLQAKDWAAALPYQMISSRFWIQTVDPLHKAGHVHAVVDKAMGAVSGFQRGGLRTCPPYLPVSAAEFKEFQKRFREQTPELMYEFSKDKAAMAVYRKLRKGAK